MNKTLVIAFTGPESTGKSTLAKAVAEHYNCELIEEYARTYLQENNRKYSFDDLEIMARQQAQLWFGPILRKDKMVILDTELTVFKIWSQYKFDQVSPWILKHQKEQNIDLYLLCKNDIEWEDDPLRENQDAHERDELFQLYYSEMKQNNFNFKIIDGEGERRFQNCIYEIDEVIKNLNHTNS